MAEHNLIQAPDLIRRLAKRLGMRQAHVTPTLAENVQGVVVMDSLQKTFEGRPDVFTVETEATGDATHITQCGLWNPTDSGVIVRLRKLNVSSGNLTGEVVTAGWVRMTTLNAGFTSQKGLSTFGLPTITSIAQTTSHVRGIQSGSVASLIGTPAWQYVADGQTIEENFEGEVYIQPGTAFLVTNDTVAIDMYGWFLWEQSPIG